MTNNDLRQLRDSVLRRDRHVEVDPDGGVREVTQRSDREPPARKPTKLAQRTFGDS